MHAKLTETAHEVTASAVNPDQMHAKLTETAHEVTASVANPDQVHANLTETAYEVDVNAVQSDLKVTSQNGTPVLETPTADALPDPAAALLQSVLQMREQLLQDVAAEDVPADKKK